MRLSEYTDYTLRVLMYCASHPQERITIAGLAEQHGLSKNHLMKVVNDLARQGLLETTRGRGGGLRLLADAQDIRIGDVVRAAETDFRLVECFDPVTNACTWTPGCRLKHMLGDALAAYFAVLDGATLADLTVVPARTRRWPAAAVPVAPPASRRTRSAPTAPPAKPRAAKRGAAR